MARVVTILADRLGTAGSIADEAAQWADALHHLGHEVRCVAGTIDTASATAPSPPHTILPGLDASTGAPAPLPDEIVTALAGSDVVVVPNLASVPFEPAVSQAVVAALRTVANSGVGVVIRHLDLPSHRAHAATTDFPARIDGAVHVATSLRARRELLALGLDRVALVHPHVDLDAEPGDRAATRAAFGFTDDEIVLLQPARGTDRKNVPGAVRFVQALAAIIPPERLHLWIAGPIDPTVAPVLDRVLARCPARVTIGRAASAADAYAACDAVLVPSAWERFGRAALEAVAARKPCVVAPYPLLGELETCGVRTFAIDEPAELVKFLARPTPQYLAANVRRARVNFSLADLPDRLATVLALLPRPDTSGDPSCT